MKKNRGNRYTNGICCTLKHSSLRFLFFELDKPINAEHFDEVIQMYAVNRLDLLCHKTGNGIHFLSPTMISHGKWKEIMSGLRHINTKCPMTTLRFEPNKYDMETNVWYIHKILKFTENYESNCIEMCDLLNNQFQTDFKGSVSRDLIKVRYPLPNIEEEMLP